MKPQADPGRLAKETLVSGGGAVAKTRDDQAELRKSDSVSPRTPADKAAEDRRKVREALREALSDPQNRRVLTELAKR